jgi:hypothetical protein
MATITDGGLMSIDQAAAYLSLSRSAVRQQQKNREAEALEQERLEQKRLKRESANSPLGQLAGRLAVLDKLKEAGKLPEVREVPIEILVNAPTPPPAER